MYASFHAGELKDALARFHEDVVIDTTARIDGGVGRGREAVVTTIGEWTSAFEEWRDEIEEVRAVGDRVYVAATQYGRGKDTGIAVADPYAVVYEVRDGLIVWMALFGDRADALRAAEAS